MDTACFKKEFQQLGFAHVPGFLSKEELQEVIKHLSVVTRSTVSEMPSNCVFYEGKVSQSTLKQLIDINLYDPFFGEMLANSKFSEIAEFFLEDEVIGKTVEYFNKPPKIGKATPPHQDGFYFMLNPSVAVTMWLALEEAGEDNGCVHYVKGSHLQAMRPHGKTQTLGFSQGIVDFGNEYDRANLVSIAAKPGDLLIHHSLTVHLAGSNQSEKSRRALGLIYFGKSAKEDVVAKAAYQKMLQAERT